jgi:hypothetical protein
MTYTLKEMNTPTLKRLSDHAQELKFDHGPNDCFWQKVDPNGRHLVVFWMRHTPRYHLWGDWRSKPDFPWNFDHNDGVNVRARVLCKMKGTLKPTELLCDFDEQDFMALPDLKVETPKDRARKRRTRRKKRGQAA